MMDIHLNVNHSGILNFTEHGSPLLDSCTLLIGPTLFYLENT